MMKPQAKKEMVISMNEQRKNLKKYILPAMLSNVSFFILTIVDGMFVGNGVGANALGAVSLAMPYVNIIWAFATLFNIGGVTVASVRFGRGDIDGANQGVYAFAVCKYCPVFCCNIGGYAVFQRGSRYSRSE